MSKSFLSLRSFQRAAVVLFVFSLVCTQIPLFDYLGFEFSALTAIIASFLTGLVTLSICLNSATNGAGIFHASTRASLALLSIPFIAMSLNAFFVKNCSYAEGAIFFLLSPLMAVLFANAFACLIATSVDRWNKTLFVFFFVLVLLHIPFVTFTGIQIFAFNPLVGFFPGFTYDETLDVTTRLFVYRIGTMFQIILIWMIADWVREKKRSRLTWKETVTVKGRWMAGGLSISLLAMLWLSDELGLSSSAKHVQDQLGGEIESEHFVITYPSSLALSRARELALLHEFYFSRLSNELRVNPRRKIQSYVYLSAEQKGRLVGASRTNISKPWLWQIHINLGDVESSLKHEMVHVMAADFGFPLLRIGPNSGLIEGLAVAVERTTYESVVHRTAAEVFAVGVRPDIESMFSWTGFFRAYAGVSYTLAGSFCRYLIDRYGLRRFKRVYRSGNFTAHYNRELSQLVVEWKEHVAKIDIEEAEKVKAAYLFKRPSIFGKECARVVANMNAETRSLYSRQDYAGALVSSSKSLERTTSVEAIFQKTNSLVRLKQYQEAIDFAEMKLGDNSIAHAVIPLNLALADAYWAAGSKEKALEACQRLLALHINLSLDEACALRLQALISHAEHLRPYFIQEIPDSVRIEFFQNALQRSKDDFLASYLLGRELSSREKYRDAIDAFSSMKDMNFSLLEYLRERRLGFLYFKIGEFQKAKLHFWRSLNEVSNEAYFIEVDEWLKRCDWMQEHAAKPNL